MSHRQIRAIPAALLALLVLAACRGRDERATKIDTGSSAIVGGDVVPPVDTTTVAVAMTDSTIFAEVESSNASEIAAGEMAAKSAHSADVKRYGRMLAREHRAMDADADRIAAELKVPSTQGPSTAPAGAGVEDAVRGKVGRDFDIAYLDAMVLAHETALETLDKAAQATNTPQVDSTLARARRKVQTHLDTARQLRAKL